MTINNEEKLQQAFDFTKIFRKTFKISFIEFLINTIVGYIFKGKCKIKSIFYYLNLFIFVELFILLKSIFNQPSVLDENYIIFISIQVIILTLIISFNYTFNHSSYTYSEFSVNTYEDEAKNKEKLNISMLRLIFQVSFLSPNLIERNESGEFILKKSKLKAVENFMIDLQSVFNSDSYNMHKFNSLIKESIKDKLGMSSEIIDFIDDNSIIDIINYCIYAEIIYLNFGNMLIKYYPNCDYDTDTLIIRDNSARKICCELDFSDERNQLTMSDNANDKLYFVRTAFGNFVSLYSNKFYKKYKSIHSLMIRWINSYDYYIYSFYTYEDILNKNICFNIPYEPSDENDIIDKNLIGRVEKRRKYLNKKISKHEARNLKREQQMKYKNYWDDVTLEDLIS